MKDNEKLSLPDAIGFELFKFHKGMKVKQNKDFAIYDLTAEQARVLMYIAFEMRGEKVRQVDIEKRFSLSNPTVTGIVQRMEGKGYLSRLSSETDKRCKEIALTEKAIEVTQEIKHKREVGDREMLTGFSEQEKEELLNYLIRLNENTRRNN